MEKQYWEDKHFSFFCNKECEYFPCHKGADVENFSCLFCYCPLYALGKECGGNYKITEKGIKGNEKRSKKGTKRREKAYFFSKNENISAFF